MKNQSIKYNIYYEADYKTKRANNQEKPLHFNAIAIKNYLEYQITLHQRYIIHDIDELAEFLHITVKQRQMKRYFEQLEDILDFKYMKLYLEKKKQFRKVYIVTKKEPCMQPIVFSTHNYHFTQKNIDKILRFMHLAQWIKKDKLIHEINETELRNYELKFVKHYLTESVFETYQKQGLITEELLQKISAKFVKNVTLLSSLHNIYISIKEKYIDNKIDKLRSKLDLTKLLEEQKNEIVFQDELAIFFKNKSFILKDELVAENSNQKATEKPVQHQVDSIKENHTEKQTCYSMPLKIAFKDMLPITDEEASIVREKSQRSFTTLAMNKLLKGIAQKRNLSFFITRESFINYVAITMRKEMRNESDVNLLDFQLNSAVDKEEIEIEKYLTQVETNLNNEDYYKLRRAVVHLFTKKKAYQILKNLRYVEINLIKSDLCSEMQNFEVVFKCYSNLNLTEEEKIKLVEQVKYIYNTEISSCKFEFTHSNDKRNLEKHRIKSLNAMQDCEYKNLISALQQHCTHRYSDAVCHSWFYKMHQVSYNNNILTLQCEFNFIKDYITDEYLEDMLEIAKKLKIEDIVLLGV